MPDLDDLEIGPGKICPLCFGDSFDAQGCRECAKLPEEVRDAMQTVLHYTGGPQEHVAADLMNAASIILEAYRNEIVRRERAENACDSAYRIEELRRKLDG